MGAKVNDMLTNNFCIHTGAHNKLHTSYIINFRLFSQMQKSSKSPLEYLILSVISEVSEYEQLCLDVLIH